MRLIFHRVVAAYVIVGFTMTNKTIITSENVDRAKRDYFDELSFCLRKIVTTNKMAAASPIKKKTVQVRKNIRCVSSKSHLVKVIIIRTQKIQIKK